MSEGVIHKRYEKLAGDRTVFLEDAYRASELTIQFLLPRNGDQKNSQPPSLKKQHQSVGAMGVNNISNKLLLALFPPNQPFFKLGIDDFTALDLAGDDKARSKVEQGFSAVERTTTDFVERTGMRPPFEEALRHLVVTGNILIHRTEDGGLEIFHMDQYVIFRDPDGKVREIVIKEFHVWDGLPDEVQALLEARGKKPSSTNPLAPKEPDDKPIAMYTRVRKISKTMWEVTQEIEGITIPTSGPNTFKDEKNPWFALRFHSIKGSAWGRGYIHNFLGDLDTLEQLWKSFTHGAKAMAFLLFMLRPGSTVTPKDIIEKINGGFISANEGDVTVLQTNKGNDFRTVMEAVDRITRRLNQALLMDSSITRDAERVTAEEIRILAERLEEALGGFYSILTQDFQQPFLTLTLDDLIKRQQIPPLPKGKVKPIIITGLDALGRNSEADRLRTFVLELKEGLGENLVAQIINPLDYATRLGSARGVDTKGLLKEQEAIDQEQADARQAELAQRTAPATIGAIGKVAGTDVGQEAVQGALQNVQQ